MLRSAKALLVPALVSACVLMLSACSGGNNSKSSVITAQANFPSSVDGGATFTVTVSLTSSNGAGGTASVVLVDMSTASSKIDCGGSQSVAIGGPSMTFSCQAPQVSLGGNNAHQLQVDVNGVANLSSPASVNVVNGGQVSAQLTNASGASITSATSGQTINVAFSTTTSPAGVGQYTVTAPSGWTVGNNGVCSLGRQSTSCTVPVTIASNAASGSYSVTIVAQSGSSPVSATSLPLSVQAQPPTPVITAHVNIPSSVDGSAVFTVGISLTSSNGSGGIASVQLADVGTATPTITCGASQSVAIGGASANFSCQAPAVSLGGNNTHQMQVDVNGVANLSSPVSVDVVNGGLVNVQFVQILSSGSEISVTQVTPGETVDVLFTTTTQPAGVGEYTVTLPSGWTVGNGGVCSINQQASMCMVPVTVAANAANGPYNVTIAAQSGSSPLSATSLPVNVQAAPPTSEMAFDLAQNLSDTLYANIQGQGNTFAYQPIFLFKNTSGSSLSIDTVNITGLTNIQYGCNIAAPDQNAQYTFNSSPDCNLTTSGLYAVTGDLPDSFPTPPPAGTPAGTASISIGIQGGGTTFVQYSTSVVFVPYVAGQVAVRVVNSNGSTVYASTYSGLTLTMLTFDPTSHIGTVSSDPVNGDFKADQIALSSTGGLLYMPYSASDSLNLTRATGGFNTSTPPNPTGNPVPPAFLTIEMSYYQNNPGGQCGTSPTCEYLTADQTYVPSISMLGSFNLMGNTKPSVLVTEDADHGTVAGMTQTQIYQNVAAFFKNQGAPWAYDATRGTPAGQQNYIQEDGGGNITEILAPIQVMGGSFDPMPSNYYDNYVNALWTYLSNPNNALYVSAEGTGESDFKTIDNTDGCVLKGQVDTNSSSPTYNELVFKPYSGTCPANGYAIGAPFNGNYCGYNGSQHATNACTDTSTQAFSKFNECDFLQAAGSAACHEEVDPTDPSNSNPQPIDPATFFENQNLWGPNGTYRALIGRAIAAYQAIGLLPPCANPTEIMQGTQAYTDITNGEGFSNPSCIGLPASAPPTWNVYAAALKPYVNVYTYTYGDFLGLDGTVSFAVDSLPQNLYQGLQVAQPVTITLH